jgi:hypothetical protein
MFDAAWQGGQQLDRRRAPFAGPRIAVAAPRQNLRIIFGV